MSTARAKRRRRPDADDLLDHADASLLELIDHVLNKGMVVSGDLMLGVANVDLVYLRLSALFCAADQIRSSRRR